MCRVATTIIRPGSATSRRRPGFKFTPIRQVALRGTWSKGFRAPSFAETSGQITGFTTYNPSNFDSGCSQHGGTVQPDGTCAGANSYVRSGQALGFRNNANPNLKPEKSESYTAGVILQPIRQVSLTLDYYHIKKTNIITGGPLSNSALDAYYAGTPLPAGYSIIQNPIDPLFPSGIRTAAIIVGPYANASSLVTSGFDFEAQADFRLAPGVRWSSNFEATRINKYDFRACGDSSDPSCDVQHYVGTQGPYILSSGAGTPRYRGNWSNSFEFGRATLTGTVNYVSGYKMTAEDQNGPGTANDCTTNLYDPGFACKVKSFTWVDLVGSYKLTDAITLYGNVLNLFDAKAPVDPANYAAANYNPTYTQAGAVGRFFRAGVNFSFRPHPASGCCRTASGPAASASRSGGDPDLPGWNGDPGDGDLPGSAASSSAAAGNQGRARLNVSQSPDGERAALAPPFSFEPDSPNNNVDGC